MPLQRYRWDGNPRPSMQPYDLHAECRVATHHTSRLVAVVLPNDLEVTVRCFSTPNVYIANPQFYDYLHFIEFRADGSVEMVDGAGQVLNTLAHGKYRVHKIDISTAEVEFYDVVQVNPYKKHEKRGDVENFRLKVVNEKGVFPFREEIVWRVDDEDAWPCLLYQSRYIFEFDPLQFGRSNQIGNYLLENKELVESARTYYIRDEVQKLTAKELEALGIPKNAFW